MPNCWTRSISPVIRVVFDTNTLVSAALSRKSVSRKAFEKGVDLGEVLASLETIQELNEVLFRSKFDKYVSVDERQLFILNYLALAKVLPITLKLNDCRDPKDNKFLELALTGNAEFLVTGDEDLLVLHPYQSVHILKSSEFLDSIEEQKLN